MGKLHPFNGLRKKAQAYWGAPVRIVRSTDGPIKTPKQSTVLVGLDWLRENDEEAFRFYMSERLKGNGKAASV